MLVIFLCAFTLLIMEVDSGWQRRLRQWLRHERLSVALALAESTHHAALRGQKTARAGRWVRGEAHGQVPEAPSPPPRSPARGTSTSTTTTACRSSGARGRTSCLSCPGRRSESRGTSWSRLSILCPSSSSSTLLCRSG